MKLRSFSSESPPLGVAADPPEQVSSSSRTLYIILCLGRAAVRELNMIQWPLSKILLAYKTTSSVTVFLKCNAI